MNHLVSMKISPVQDFIKESRKAQDAYSASKLLSFVCREMVACLKDFSLEIVYPDISGQMDSPEPMVTNEALALAHEGIDAALCAQKACRAGIDCFREVARKVWERLETNQNVSSADRSLWDDQIQGQFQSFWAVAAVENAEDPEEMARALQRVKALLDAARHSPQASPYEGEGIRKCSLCAQWEVLPLRAAQSLEALDEKERLCAPCLVKRYASRWGAFADSGAQSRFPSTSSIAWAARKRKLVESVIDGRIDTASLQRFCAAAAEFASMAGEEFGEQSLPHHGELLGACEIASLGSCGALPHLPRLRKEAVEKFLGMDGQWLDPVPTLRERYSRLPAGAAAKLERLASERGNLPCQELLADRAPLLAILVVDLDELGTRQHELIQRSGWVRGRELSGQVSRFVSHAREILETEGTGRAAFASGDEIMGALPESEALRAVALMDLALKERIPGITMSAAIVTIPAHKPLRHALDQARQLLKEAKHYRRPCLWEDGRPIERHALGLAAIPGSGDAKWGVTGLELPKYGPQGVSSWHAVLDVLDPLRQSLSLPEDCGIGISPDLFRDLAGEFASALPSVGEPQMCFVEPSLMGTAWEGIFMSEVKRLAGRHIEVDGKADAQRIWHDERLRPWLPKFADAGEPAWTQDRRKDAGTLKSMLIDGMARRIASLAFAGNPGRVDSSQSPWNYFTGLLKALTFTARGEVRR